MKKSILIISPFAFHPADAGHRRRTLQTLDFFADFEVTFLLYAFEGEWIYKYQSDDMARMRTRVSDLLVYKGRYDIGANPASGPYHELDEWYDAGFESTISNMLRFRHFDAVVVHNVWLSKYLDCFPLSTVKIIETHDIFSSRLQAYNLEGVPSEFFVVQAKDEVFGLERADIAIAIQQKEGSWIERNTSAVSLTIPYYAPDAASQNTRPASQQEYRHPDVVRFGFLGSAHAFNKHGLKLLMNRLAERVPETLAPLELVIGGAICRDLQEMGPGCWTLQGYVANDDVFYSCVDFMVVPVVTGSGFKVKVADAVARGIPLLSTEHAAAGLQLDPACIFPDIDSIAEKMIQLSFDRPPLDDYAAMAIAADEEIRARAARAIARLTKMIAVLQPVTVFDFRALSGALELIYLAGLSGIMRVAHGVSRVILLSMSDVAREAVRFFGTNLEIATTLSDADLIGRPVTWIDAHAGLLRPRRGVFPHLAPWDSIDFDPSAVPLFSDNRAWDPMYQWIASRLQASVNLPSSILLVDTRNETTSVAAMLKFGIAHEVVAADDMERCELLFMALFSGEISQLVDFTSGDSLSRAIAYRLAKIKGVKLVKLRSSTTDEVEDWHVKDYWSDVLKWPLAERRRLAIDVPEESPASDTGFSDAEKEIEQAVHVERFMETLSQDLDVDKARLRETAREQRFEDVLTLVKGDSIREEETSTLLVMERPELKLGDEICLDYLAENCLGVYPVEYDDKNEKMLWTSGEADLRLDLAGSATGSIEVFVTGLAHQDVVGKEIEAIWNDSSVASATIHDTRYAVFIFKLRGDPSESRAPNILTLRFPSVEDRPARAADRALSFLLYELRVVAQAA